MKVADQNAADVDAAGGHDVGRVGRGPHGPRGLHLADAVSPRPDVGEREDSGRAGHRADFARVEGTVDVGVQENRDAGHARVARVADAVAIQVVELHPAERHQPEVTEIDAGDNLPTGQGDR